MDCKVHHDLQTASFTTVPDMTQVVLQQVLFSRVNRDVIFPASHTPHFLATGNGSSHSSSELQTVSYACLHGCLHRFLVLEGIKVSFKFG